MNKLQRIMYHANDEKGMAYQFPFPLISHKNNNNHNVKLLKGPGEIGAHYELLIVDCRFGFHLI